MKITSFRHQNKDCYGIVTDKGVIDLTKRFGKEYKDLRSFIEGNQLHNQEVQSIALENDIDYPLSDIQFAPVIPNPDKIICVGVNYDEHRLEAKSEKADNPTIFFRLAQSQIGHNEPMLLPPESQKLDYEGEIAVIIGRTGRRIPVDQAYDYIAGYSIYNDGSIRDYQLHTPQWGPGKNFNNTGALGPWLVTKDDITDGQVLKLETRLNGEVMQYATTDMLMFSIPQLINYISTFTTLLPGDVIVTGTPSGVGLARNPQIFMKPGDVVEIEVSNIGILRNTIKAE
jgi:2-keto-4-pentenoate hydratase/2-oxohepta-3-ene-1,7-dioic acid hydratase in catechol pathway